MPPGHGVRDALISCLFRAPDGGAARIPGSARIEQVQVRGIPRLFPPKGDFFWKKSPLRTNSPAIAVGWPSPIPRTARKRCGSRRLLSRSPDFAVFRSTEDLGARAAAAGARAAAPRREASAASVPCVARFGAAATCAGPRVPKRPAPRLFAGDEKFRNGTLGGPGAKDSPECRRFPLRHDACFRPAGHAPGPPAAPQAPRVEGELVQHSSTALAMSRALPGRDDGSVRACASISRC